MTLGIRHPGARLAVLLLCLAAMPAAADTTPTREYELKAALIYKLARFVEWPEGHLRDALRICVLGRDPFGSAIDALEARKRNELPIEVWRIAADDARLGACSILFITREKATGMKLLRSKLKGQPILTIGDSEAFARSGGTIQMALERKKIRFIVNLWSAEEAGLKIAAPLLDLSTVIRSQGAGARR